MVLPPRNEMMEGELKQRIKESDFDGVLVIRPKAMRKESKEVVTGLAGPYYVPPAGYYSFWPYWNMAWGQVYPTSSYVKEETYVSTEFNLYNTKDEKLLWSGETETVYSKDFGKLARGVCQSARQAIEERQGDWNEMKSRKPRKKRTSSRATASSRTSKVRVLLLPHLFFGRPNRVLKKNVCARLRLRRLIFRWLGRWQPEQMFRDAHA